QLPLPAARTPSAPTPRRATGRKARATRPSARPTSPTTSGCTAAARPRSPRRCATAAPTRCRPGASSSARKRPACSPRTSGACRMASKPPDAVATAWRNGENRFSGALVALHWATLLLVAAAYACIELRELYPKGSDPREMLKAWHYALGMSVLVLTALRIAMAAVGGAQPPVHPAPPRWQRGAAAVMHAALYA